MACPILSCVSQRQGAAFVRACFCKVPSAGCHDPAVAISQIRVGSSLQQLSSDSGVPLFRCVDQGRLADKIMRVVAGTCLQQQAGNVNIAKITRAKESGIPIVTGEIRPSTSLQQHTRDLDMRMLRHTNKSSCSVFTNKVLASSGLQQKSHNVSMVTSRCISVQLSPSAISGSRGSCSIRWPMQLLLASINALTCAREAWQNVSLTRVKTPGESRTRPSSRVLSRCSSLCLKRMGHPYSSCNRCFKDRELFEHVYYFGLFGTPGCGYGITAGACCHLVHAKQATAENKLRGFRVKHKRRQ